MSNENKSLKKTKFCAKAGFSLIEILVSVALFVVIVMSATEIFRIVIQSQREAIAAQNVQESLKYFFEVISKEIRMAKRNDGSCSNPGFINGQIFSVSNNGLGKTLNFKNYYNECVTYELVLDSSGQESRRFKISRNNNSGFISPKSIEIGALDFTVRETTARQPLVTIFLSARSLEDGSEASKMDIQTTISSRYYQ